MSEQTDVFLCMCGRRGCLNQNHAPISRRRATELFSIDGRFHNIVIDLHRMLSEGVSVPGLCAAFNLALEMIEKQKTEP